MSRVVTIFLWLFRPAASHPRLLAPKSSSSLVRSIRIRIRPLLPSDNLDWLQIKIGLTFLNVWNSRVGTFLAQTADLVEFTFLQPLVRDVLRVWYLGSRRRPAACPGVNDLSRVGYGLFFSCSWHVNLPAHIEDTPPAEQVNVLAKRIEALERQLAAASAELQAIKAEQSKTASPTGGDAVLSAAEDTSDGGHPQKPHKLSASNWGASGSGCSAMFAFRVAMQKETSPLSAWTTWMCFSTPGYRTD